MGEELFMYLVWLLGGTVLIKTGAIEYIWYILFGTLALLIIWGLYSYEIEEFVTMFVPKLIPAVFIGFIISIWLPIFRKK
jgi:hypothetical protein